uniref:M20_dimer domain-containing protein n=2 Tax=Wuchereria bancrofti TaxID=6293 RepID=A0A1I8EGH2_WUCBA
MEMTTNEIVNFFFCYGMQILKMIAKAKVTKFIIKHGKTTSQEHSKTQRPSRRAVSPASIRTNFDCSIFTPANVISIFVLDNDRSIGPRSGLDSMVAINQLKYFCKQNVKKFFGNAQNIVDFALAINITITHESFTPKRREKTMNVTSIIPEKEEDIAVRHFREYLRINTAHPNPDYEKCIRFLFDLVDGLNFERSVHECVPGKPFIIMTLRGHFDGKIYGRGAQDMKSIGIQYVEAIRRLFKNSQNQGNFLRTLHIVWGPDEEIGGEDGMEKFVERIVISCKGEAGHGLQLIGNTASEKLQKIINSFMKFREEQKKLLELNKDLTLSNVISVNLTKIEGGVQLNVLPTEIKVWFDLRIPPMHNFEELEDQISKWCTDAGSDVTFSFIKNTRIKAMTPVTDDDPWWHAFSSVFKQLNYPILLDIFPGSTDSRFLRQKGIRSIGFSPINKTPLLLHAYNEYITEECFLNGVTIYEKLIEKLANLPG